MTPDDFDQPTPEEADDALHEAADGHVNDASDFDGWAVVEIMGHRRLAGRVRSVTLGAAPMIRLDIPLGDEYVTHFYATSAIFSLCPVDERGARAVALHAADSPAPVKPYQLPPAPRTSVSRGQVEMVLAAAAGDIDVHLDEVMTVLANKDQLDDGIPF